MKHTRLHLRAKTKYHHRGKESPPLNKEHPSVRQQIPKLWLAHSMPSSLREYGLKSAEIKSTSERFPFSFLSLDSIRDTHTHTHYKQNKDFNSWNKWA
mmetsp:Transcript_63564/g.72848  ORF Transcript_63564/g.72848 Transcript_63564/m.72848 type:complete len:98 (+) Transcript_63564:394-687(+)